MKSTKRKDDFVKTVRGVGGLSTVKEQRYI
jgi:hypothetical protein